MSDQPDNPLTKTAYFAVARDAHSFGALLGFLAFVSGAIVVVWFLGASFFGWPLITAGFSRFTTALIAGYFVYSAIRALIGYTLTTAQRLFSEWCATVAGALADSMVERPAPIGQEGNVTYLRDILKATAKASTEEQP